MKRIILLFLLAAVLLTACKDEGKTEQGVKVSPSAAEPTKQVPDPNDTKTDPGSQKGGVLTGVTAPEIVDPPVVTTVFMNGRKVAEVTDMESATITDAGILYKLCTMTGRYKADAEYHILNTETGEDRKLGTIRDEGYETRYNRVELNGKIYTLIVKGELDREELQSLILLEIDPAGALTEQVICKDGFAYAMLARCNDCLLIGNHGQSGEKADSVYLYDPKDGSVKEVLRYQEGTQPLRQIYSDGKQVYVLLARAEDGKTQLVIETYDLQFNKLSERDITALGEKANTGEIPDEWGGDEFLMHVSRFIVTESGIMYYENFSVTHFLLNLETGEILRDTDAFLAALGGNGELYFDMMKGFEPERDKPNYIYMLDGTKLTRTEYIASDPWYYIMSMSVSNNGTLMMVLEYSDLENINPDLPPMMIIQ
ncbi:MAG: hypothetical protein J5648_05260 [Lachnospiraceae bacterium]|nr:hypothetical protein [Lachnospiraceae bacterium]